MRSVDRSAACRRVEARRVKCSNCGVAMKLDDIVLARLREQAIDALARTGRLK